MTIMMVPDVWEELLGSAVKKKIIVGGDGDIPDYGSVVVFNWMGSELVDGIDGIARTPFCERKGATARIGDGDEIPGSCKMLLLCFFIMPCFQFSRSQAKVVYRTCRDIDLRNFLPTPFCTGPPTQKLILYY